MAKDPSTWRGPRDAALRALLAVRTESRRPKQALHEVLAHAGLADADRALATALVYGVSRMGPALDQRLARHCRRSLERLSPSVRVILQMAVYQLEEMDRIPAHAAVNEAVEQAKRHAPPGARGFVNAVLRSLQRERERRGSASAAAPGRAAVEETVGAVQTGDGAESAAELAGRLGFPDWLAERWLARYGREGATALMRWFNRPPVVTLRINGRRATIEQVRRSLEAQGVAVEAGRLDPAHALRVRRVRGLDRLEAFQRGWVQVQDEGAQLAATLLDPQPGEFVIDLAAAPGGKTMQIAEAMGDRGHVLAVDPDRARAALIRENARRLGFSCVRTLVADGRRLPRRLSGCADRVLADVPCSGTGVLHRRAEARWRKRETDPSSLAPLQLELARAAAACLRPGGRMVYSTCSLEPEENVGVVTRLLAEVPDLRAVDLRPHLPAALRDAMGADAVGGEAGAARAEGEVGGVGGEAAAARGWLQLLPQVHDVDGFFVALLEKR